MGVSAIKRPAGPRPGATPGGACVPLLGGPRGRWQLGGAVVALLLLAPAAAGQSVTLPEKIEAQPGEWVIIVPTAHDGGPVRWHVSPGLIRVPIEKLFPKLDPAGVVVRGPKGTYQVWAWTAKGDRASPLAVCVVQVGEPTPTPPDPPPPPPPDGPLAKALAAAWAKEADTANRARQAADLAALYSLAAGETVNDVGIKTVGALYGRLIEARKRLMPDNSLPHVRQAVADYLAGNLPTDEDAALDAATRAQAGRAFAAVSQALSTLR